MHQKEFNKVETKLGGEYELPSVIFAVLARVCNPEGQRAAQIPVGDRDFDTKKAPA